MPQTLIAVVVANSWIKTPGWQSGTSERALSAFWVSTEENLSQLFRDFKPCTLQSYKFKIHLRRTETSVINNEFAKVVAHLCSESRIESCKKVYVDFLKLTHYSFISSHATRTSEHFLRARETKQHRDQEPFRISMRC